MSSGFARHCFEKAYKAGWNDCVKQLEAYKAGAAEYETDMFAEIYEGPNEPEEDGYDEDDMQEAWQAMKQEAYGPLATKSEVEFSGEVNGITINVKKYDKE